MISRVSLAGAAGVVGRLVTGIAAEHDVEVVPWDPRRGEPAEPASTVIAAVPESEVGSVIEAALAVRVGVVAAVADARAAADLIDRFDAPARSAGVPVVPTAGWDPLVADLLAARAASALPDPTEAHVAYATPRAGLSRRSPGERRRFAEGLGQPFPVLEDGRTRSEREAEARRLAWFPRPVGPRHAAGTSSAAVVTLPRHLPTLDAVRGYRASSTAAAEARQMLANTARWEPARSVMGAFLTRDRPETDRADVHWACVVELATATGLSRAWAHGVDHVAVTASALLLVARALDGWDGVGGVRAPAEVLDAGDTLDDLAARSRLRWGRAASDQVGG